MEKEKFLVNQKPESDEGKPGINRRDFLKLSFAGLGAAAVYAVQKKYGWLKNISSPAETHENQIVDNSPEIEIEKEIPSEDIKSAEMVVGPLERKQIKMNKETAKGVEEFWYRQYKSDNLKLVRSLESAYLAMQPYVADLEKIFLGEGVPKQYLYLAIPESHWKLNAESHAAAVGPYQFTKPTAENYGLTVNDKIDERKDPLKSARACAKNLRYLFDKTGDWDLAASGYNGSFIWRFLKNDMRAYFKKDFDGFLRYLAWNINAIKEYIPKNNIWWHKTRKGQSLTSISNYYKMPERVILGFNANIFELKKAGNRWRYIVSKEQKIKIPIHEAADKKRVYDAIIRGLSENLNYPPKFNAVARIIKEKYQKDINASGKRELRVAKK